MYKMNRLPHDIFLEIFDKLNCEEKLQICKTNKNFLRSCLGDKKISRELALCKIINNLSKDEIETSFEHNFIDYFKNISMKYKHLNQEDVDNIFKNEDTVYKTLIELYPDMYLGHLKDETTIGRGSDDNFVNDNFGKYVAKNWRKFMGIVDDYTLFMWIFYSLTFFDVKEAKAIKKYIINDNILQEFDENGKEDWFTHIPFNTAQNKFYRFLYNRENVM